MTTPVSKIITELADREAIRETLYCYARGIDRIDADMIRSAYWPDAVDEHLEFKGDTEAYIAWVFPQLKTMDQTMHMIGNVLIRLNGDSADVESYYYAYHRANVEGRKRDVIGAGRYLDKFEKRGDEWRVFRRFVVTDWLREYPDSADWSAGMLGMPMDMGGRYPEDPSYSRLNFK